MTSEKSHDLTLFKEVAEEWRKDALVEREYSTTKFLVSRLDKDIRRIGKFVEPHDKYQWEMFGGSRNIVNQKEATKQLLKRISMAVIGGAFLIGPMLVMVLHKSLLTTFLTSSVFVVIFGIVLAFALDNPFNVLSGTAAYAAVLVVFVGTSSS